MATKVRSSDPCPFGLPEILTGAHVDTRPLQGALLLQPGKLQVRPGRAATALSGCWLAPAANVPAVWTDVPEGVAQESAEPKL